MVYRFCVASDACRDNAYDESANSLAYAAFLLERDADAAALLVNGALPAMIDAWYAQRGDYPPARDQVVSDLAARAPEVAEALRLALHASDVRARIRSAQHLLAVLRGRVEVVGG